MLILLDIDGVLVPANSWKKPELAEDGFPLFNLKSVKALQKILLETNADILLTTSHKTKYNITKWRKLLKSRGIIVTKLQRLNSNSLQVSRKDEILNWRKTNATLNDHYVIIDDDKTLNDLPENIKENLVLTSPYIGLTNELAEEAIAILKKKQYQFHF